MKEIKFRQWCSRDKKFHYWGYLDKDWEHFGNPLGYMSKDNERNSQQFTGLLDKNKKEIYEGDICKCKVADDYDGEYREEKITITFSYGAFCPIFLRDRDFHDFDDKPIRYKEFEIIGNIYENPELLKGPSK